MAVLTAKQRRAIPAHKYGIPPKGGKPGRYPVNDKEHARKALQLINTGHNVSAADKRRIRRLASEELYGKAASTEAKINTIRDKKKKAAPKRGMSAANRAERYARGG